jgi:hypothetical protein
LLTVTFPASAEVQKKMCESNSRAAQIQALLSEHCGRDLRLKLETSADLQIPIKAVENQPKTIGQKRNELINDPAVRTVLMGLDATITGIEDNQQNG